MCHPDAGAPFAGGGEIAERETWVDRGGPGGPIRAKLYRAAAGRGAPGVVIIHDVFGHGEFYRDMGRRLAAAGFTTLLPDLFHRLGQIQGRDRQAASARRARFDERLALADLAAALRLLRDEEGAPRVGAIGFCMGGTLTMLLAAREPLDAGVVFYGFPANRNRTELAPFQVLDEAERIAAPLLGFWGDRDEGVGMDNVRRLDEALGRAGKAHEFTIYPGLPHGFLTFDEAAPHGGESRDAWARTLAFFEEHLSMRRG